MNQILLKNYKKVFEIKLLFHRFIDLFIDFQYLDLTYLLGTADDVNCKLEGTPNCDDHELATYCQAMLQG